MDQIYLNEYMIMLKELYNIIHRNMKRQTYYIQILLVDEYVKILQEAYYYNSEKCGQIFRVRVKTYS